MLNIEKWRKRLLKAWAKKVRMRHQYPPPPREATTRWQAYSLGNGDHGHCRVSLLIWDDAHAWIIVYGKKIIHIECDEPIGQTEVERWLEQTKPVE